MSNKSLFAIVAILCLIVWFITTTLGIAVAGSAYNSGYKAASIGISSESNPYDDSNGRVHWLKGYMDYKTEHHERNKE